MENLISLDFTTTACNRPALLDRTYSSYTKNLKGIDFEKSTLYLNVDPAPKSNSITQVEEVAKKYFGKVICNYPETPNFASAIIWLFSKPVTDYFFHLEDDWQLCRQADIFQMINRVSNSTLQCVLNKKPSAITRKELGEPCLVPSLFSTKIIQSQYLPFLNNLANPEYQLKNLYRKNHNGLKEFKSIAMNSNVEFSKDIGRDWLKKNKLSRDYSIKGKIKSPKRWTPWINWK